MMYILPEIRPVVSGRLVSPLSRLGNLFGPYVTQQFKPADVNKSFRNNAVCQDSKGFPNTLGLLCLKSAFMQQIH